MGRTCGTGAVSLGRVAKIAQIGSCCLAPSPAEEQDGRHVAQQLFRQTGFWEHPPVKVKRSCSGEH
jgi:hypothetical protein